MAETTVTIAPSNIHIAFSFKILTKDQHSKSDSMPTTYHLYVNIICHKPVSPGDGAPQLANTSISTSVKKWNAVCHIGRFSGKGTIFI